MQPPIPTGTVLQNRYRVLQVLGQGGFGRTYLAEDQGRFNERCALKEFIPPQGSDYSLNKARELFQREAAILYQIHHPQIPQFRAIFEENQRLFLVQDYVEGKTYRALLNERKLRGFAFSEAEILQLIQQLLPVLAHIHGKNIIHRDIAPDNIMLRQQDNLPVLIDFGVVKEIATRVHAADEAPTTVGKLGYAPSEQIQTGRAYPSSDLYALAVTALVLMTGREPQELYDDRDLTWNWQRWITLSPGFAQVLTRMLSYRPGDRYQSVGELVQALQMLISPPAISHTPPPAPPLVPPASSLSSTPVSKPVTPKSDVSQMQTIAVGRRPNPVSTYSRPSSSRQTPPPVIPTPQESSVWENPWAVIAIGAGLATVTGIAAWAIVSAILNTSQPTPVPLPTPVPTVVPTPSPDASPSPEPTPSPSPAQPVEYSQRLDLPATGETTTVEGALQANEAIVYIIPIEQGQTLSATLDGEGVLLSVLAPDRQPVNDSANRVLAWQGTLDTTGEYLVRLSPLQGVSSSNYRLSLSLEAVPTPSPTPSPSPPPPAEPTIDTQVLNPPLGPQGTQVSDQASDVRIKRYLVNAQLGQVLNAELLQGAVTLNIRYPDGQLVENASGIVTWSSQISVPGDYQIDVIATQPTDFTLHVSLLGVPLPPPLPPVGQ
ncbi:MAG: serine/threonine protein kinase [Synechococcales cyanobacterium M58_A2018_015]|nr:serine/threonine protein kinase [Synechococcales cyanobacterium M58_A2018_015]